MMEINNSSGTSETTDSQIISAFYSGAAQYWASHPPTDESMLGWVDDEDIDLVVSQRLLDSIYQLPERRPGKESALDGGAGIGRVTQGLLMKHFEVVDLVDQDGKFIEEAQRVLASTNHKGEFFHSGLQNFTPKLNAYDLIWLQWVLCHMTDEDFVNFLKRCRASLKPNGVIVIKDNMNSSGEVGMDKEFTLIRPRGHFIELIQRSGYTVVKDEKQEGYSADFREIRMFAIQPALP